jgi:hypothetical protein
MYESMGTGLEESVNPGDHMFDLVGVNQVLTPNRILVKGTGYINSRQTTKRMR